MPVTFQVVGNLADFGNDARAGVKVRATASPGIKVGNVAVHSNAPETVVTDEDGAFALELVSLPGVWYRIHTPYAGALPTINLAGYVPDVDDPTTGTAFPEGTVIDVKDVADENPAPGYEAVVFGGNATWAALPDKPTLGTAAAAAVGDFATAAQGLAAESALQPADVATVATSGAYADLTGKPTLGTAAATDATAYATAAQGTKADTAVQPAAIASLGTLNPGGMVGPPVQGLYARTRPGPDTSGLPIRPLAKDPSVAGRLWCVGTAFAQIGFTDDDCATWTPKTASPAGSVAGVQGMLFGGGFAWLLQGPNQANKGSLWRSPLPNAAGVGLSWTKMFDLAAPPGGITTGDQATFRNSSVAVSGANVYLAEYSVTTITNGASLYYSPDSGATWSKVKTWANAKHIHAVKVIGGVPWVMIGDAGFSDLGLWTATAANAAAWNRRSIYGPEFGGNYLYGINFFPITVDSVPMVVSEYDGAANYGPLFHGSQDPTVNRPEMPGCQLPPTHRGTGRQMTLTSEGNLMWVHSSENGALGPVDSVWISKPPFTSAVLLETIGTPMTETMGDAVENGNYIWFGSYRVRKEKFVGQ